MSSKLQITSTYERQDIDKAIINKPPVERFAFNLSFLTPGKRYNLGGKQVEKEHRLKLPNKTYNLSQRDVIELVSHDDRHNGLEQILESEMRDLRIDPAFKRTRYNSCEENYWVFRLSNQGRVTGKKYKNIFYTTSIDTRFKQYNHGS